MVHYIREWYEFILTWLEIINSSILIPEAPEVAESDAEGVEDMKETQEGTDYQRSIAKR
jgi:hypothetical protein